MHAYSSSSVTKPIQSTDHTLIYVSKQALLFRGWKMEQRKTNKDMDGKRETRPCRKYMDLSTAQNTIRDRGKWRHLVI